MNLKDVKPDICLSILKEFNEKKIHFVDAMKGLSSALICHCANYKLRKEEFVKVLEFYQILYNKVFNDFEDHRKHEDN